MWGFYRTSASHEPESGKEPLTGYSIKRVGVDHPRPSGKELERTCAPRQPNAAFQTPSHLVVSACDGRIDAVKLEVSVGVGPHALADGPTQRGIPHRDPRVVHVGAGDHTSQVAAEID